MRVSAKRASAEKAMPRDRQLRVSAAQRQAGEHGPDHRHHHKHRRVTRHDHTLLLQTVQGRAAPRRLGRAFAGLSLGLFFATTLLAWNFAPDLRERTIHHIDTGVTSGLELLLGDSWRPEPTSYAEFAAQTLQVPQEVPGFPLDIRSAVRKVFLDKGTLDSARALRVADTLVDEAQKLGVDPLLLLAVIEVESKFDPRATSLRGARGLMQLMPDTRAWLIDRTPELWNETSKDDQLSPESNVRVGVHYFAHLARGFRGIEHVLQAYNCGPGRLVAILNGESVLPEESKYYADKVLRIHARLRREFQFAKL